ncbi:serine/threonine-protein kinase [Millisia brevis]|uniref:serine/threonine-protein kinase n=1 Tax=Millisia brevis TaxID=264148 RepID=UPI000833C08B|nr:serine/threonine-protein kinase [Millisia brevis]
MFRSGEVVAGLRIDRPLGRGGSSDVYRAYRPGSDESVAWKVMRPEAAGSDAAHERFRKEFDVAALFDHPHIVRMYDHGTVPDRRDDRIELPWLSMQCVDDGSAADLVPARGREPDVPRIVEVCRGIAEALDVVHAAGVVHRDVKPANMLIDGRSHAVLIDFGIAQYAGSDRDAVRTGMIHGTIAYAAPEVLTGRPLTGATDEYAFAAGVFELLTGTTPYPRATATAAMRAHLRESVPSITSRRRWLPHSLDSVFAKALDKDPARRYSNCLEFVDIVGRTLRGVPIPGERY